MGVSWQVALPVSLSLRRLCLEMELLLQGLAPESALDPGFPLVPELPLAPGLPLALLEVVPHAAP